MANEPIIGMKEGINALKRMEQAAQLRVMRSALNAALTPALKAVRQNAPRGKKPHKTYKGRVVAPGFLSRNTRKGTRISKDRKKVLGRVSFKSEAFYGQFVEQGGKNAFGKGITIPARPFFFKAIAGTEQESERLYFGKMNERIQKAWRG